MSGIVYIYYACQKAELCIFFTHLRQHKRQSSHNLDYHRLHYTPGLIETLITITKDPRCFTLKCVHKKPIERYVVLQHKWLLNILMMPDIFFSLTIVVNLRISRQH